MQKVKTMLPQEKKTSLLALKNFIVKLFFSISVQASEISVNF